MVQVALVSSGSRPGANRPQQEARTGGFVILLATMAVIGGLLFGYDTGIVSAAMLFIPDNAGMKPMDDFFTELIVAITPGMAGVGALLAGPASNKWGRRKTILFSSALFAVGALICAGAPEKYVLLLGRITLGLAIGFSSMIVPVYVGEASPANVRGRLVTGFQLMITLGLVVASVVAGGFAYIDPENVGWRLMVGFAAVPAIIQFVGFIFLPESPRWLIEHDFNEEAEVVLGKIYGDQKDWVQFEIDEITAARDEERQAKLEAGGDSGLILFRILGTAHVRKALFIGGALQMFQQLAGVNTLMYYTGAIIRSAGVKDLHTTVWISCGNTAVNFFFTFVPMYLIERLGRRVLLLASVAGVITSLLLLGGGFLLINKDTALIATGDQWNGLNETTLKQNSDWYKAFLDCHSLNCDDCVLKEACGYCYPENSTLPGDPQGQCLPASDDDKENLSKFGLCSNKSTTGDNKAFHWADNYCVTNYTVVPIVLMVVYLVFFSSGYGPVPWVFNSEVYPLWARSTCVSLATAVNWTFNLIVSLTFLSLGEAITKYGAFFLYAGITTGAWVFFYIFVPETKGYPIEEIERLFMTKRRREEAMEKHRQNSRTENVDEKEDKF